MERHRQYALVIDLEGNEMCLKRNGEIFQCLCEEGKIFSTISGFQKTRSKLQVPLSVDPLLFEENDECESDEDIELYVVARKDVDIPNLPLNTTTESTARTYDEAILNACGANEWNDEEKKRILGFMDSYNLRPLSMFNEENIELNSLTNEKNLNKHNGNSMKTSAIVPAKHKYKQASISVHSLSSYLYSAISCGPPYLRSHIINSDYFELDHNIAKFLNQNWSLFPNLRFACSRALVGAVFLNPSTNKALFVNCIEIYGRRRSIDSHRESFRTVNEQSAPSSLPPNYIRLRLDISAEPEIGPNTTSILLDTREKSANARIFIKKTAWNAAIELSKADRICSITPYDVVYQPHQLRTRFHHLSTYFMCRAFNDNADDIRSRPYTIFTLTDWDNGANDTDYRVESKILQDIAMSVIQSGHSATLFKDKFLRLMARLKSDKVMQKYFKAIAKLFDSDSLKIIGNKELNIILQNITESLNTPIAKVNESAKQVVTTSFAKS
ncbi:MAG: hypothetical protein EXX96DRAFT_634944 [Benjaminiella poitrasii]|nr:MAG: hypothetical protein EXX96DRAFT_634944 [Benjaminiella poitrasii]